MALLVPRELEETKSGQHQLILKPKMGSGEHPRNPFSVFSILAKLPYN
jgi:hypothetical protein